MARFRRLTSWPGHIRIYGTTHQMTPALPLLIGIATSAATYAGGRFALRYRHKLSWLMGFSGGAVLGVAAFDLFPEAKELARGRFGVEVLLLFAAAGFSLYLTLSRVQGPEPDLHPGPLPAGEGTQNLARGQNGYRNLGLYSLVLHSLLDGIGIGLALKVSVAVGLIVAIGVLTHDFADGINTIAIALRDSRGVEYAQRWLICDAAAPLAGILSTRFFAVPRPVLGLLLALFCGLFVFIGAFDLLPDGYRKYTKAGTTALAALGAAAIYAAVAMARRL